MTTKSARRPASSTKAFLEKLSGGPLTFGHALSAIRLSDELSLAAFAQRLGVSRTHLSDIEHGRRSVSLLRASEFATALGYSEAHFVRLALQDQVRDAGLKLKVDVRAA
jgi:transcriptional regulator with XRE-family HTH domain